MLRKQSEEFVFLNIPYDPRFQDLCLAYIVGAACFGLTAGATLEIPGGARRLDRIVELISSCKSSIHDLSRVQLDRHQPRTPRFNMPFDLGLTVAWQRLGDRGHVWFVFESRQYRLSKSLSDLSGTDVYIHGGTIAGIFQQLCNALIGEKQQPSVADMMSVYRAGFPADAISQHGATALHWAAWHGNAEMVRLLLPHRPQLENCANDYRSAPLGWAMHGSENGWHRQAGDYAATVEALLDAGAKPPEFAGGSEAVRESLRRHGIA